MADVDLTPFADAWREYQAAGWPVIPLPPAMKDPPPVGYTGADGKTATEQQLEQWERHGFRTREHGHVDAGNIALRMPDGVIGIDVDAYDGKTGDQSLAELVDRYGPLPPTWMSSSRTDGRSGISFYRVPPGTRLNDKPGPNIEIIQHHHRYAIVWPSVHPNGGIYRWQDDTYPAVDQLPLLPDTWLEGLRHNPDQPRPTTPARAARNDQWRSRAVEAQLAQALTDLHGGRHDAAATGSMALVRLAHLGHPGANDALEDLHRVFVQAVTHDGSRNERSAEAEWQRMITGARAKVASTPATRPPWEERTNPAPARSVSSDPLANPQVEAQPAVDESELDAFWHARPELERMHHYALAKRASPWAALGVALTRIICAVPPRVTLPDIIGSRASLNLFIGLVGPSGGGKGAALAVGTDAVAHTLLDHIDTHTPGSGHGIAHAYAHREKGELVRDADTALFTIEEVDHLVGLSGQTGSTLLAELRRVYMAEKLGHLFVDPAKRIPIDAHSYRAGLIVGIQPTRAGVLLDDADGGTPQRFVWLPTTYPHPDIRPDAPEPWRWQPPTFIHGPIDVCDTAVAEIDAAALARSRGEGDPLDGHRLLCREKVAAALGFLHGHAGITDDDWTLSNTIMRISDATRAGVVHDLALAAKARNRARGESEADRISIIDQRKEDLARARVAQWLLRKLRAAQGEWVRGLRSGRNGIDSARRELFDQVVLELEELGEIERRDTVVHSGETSSEYRIANRGGTAEGSRSQSSAVQQEPRRISNRGGTAEPGDRDSAVTPPRETPGQSETGDSQAHATPQHNRGASAAPRFTDLTEEGLL
jgi:hypothetical protein